MTIQDIFPNKVRYAITHLCFFFNAICSEIFDLVQLDELENQAAIILCQLEMYFPPSFFDTVSLGYSSNIKSLVQFKDIKLVGLKSHDWHVLMQQLLAMVLQDIFS